MLSFRKGAKWMSPLIELFITFAKIALFTFGVGYAMLSLIENKCVEQK